MPEETKSTSINTFDTSQEILSAEYRAEIVDHAVVVRITRAIGPWQAGDTATMPKAAADNLVVDDAAEVLSY